MTNGTQRERVLSEGEKAIMNAVLARLEPPLKDICDRCEKLALTMDRVDKGLELAVLRIDGILARPRADEAAQRGTTRPAC